MGVTLPVLQARLRMEVKDVFLLCYPRALYLLKFRLQGYFLEEKKIRSKQGKPLKQQYRRTCPVKKNTESKLNPKNTIFLLFILFLLLVIVSITFLSLFMGLVLFKSLMVLFQLNFSFIYHTLSKKISISAKINYFQMNTK